ncbi:MAG: hypothetical protein JWN93_2454 [Hyphomicrobiales bacterium]|nr:hypothetical protein [Hyphomicrobiales bacterium]
MTAVMATVRTLPRPSATLLVCLAACAGGLLGRVMEDLSGAEQTLLLGLSPLELLVIFVAARLVMSGDPAEAGVGAPHALAAVGLLAPSGALAWGVLGAFASWRAIGASAPVRTGLLLLAALAVSEAWMSVGFKTVAGHLLALDAQVAAVTLALLGFPTQVVGNVVEVAGGNNIVVLVTCATLHRLPLAIVAAMALAAPASPRRALVVCALVAAGYAALNMARLVGMGVSGEWYAFLHNGAGASLYDAAQTALVFLVASRASK